MAVLDSLSWPHIRCGNDDHDPGSVYFDSAVNGRSTMSPIVLPIAHGQLVAEVKEIYAGLVRVEKKCIEIDKKATSMTGPRPKQNIEQWRELDRLHRKISTDNKDSSSAFVPRSSTLQHTKLRMLVKTYSLQSRSWRRLNDRLLPLLRREQDFESSMLWLELMKLSESLSESLNKSTLVLENLEQEAADILKEVLDLVELVLERLTMRFRLKYTTLKHTTSFNDLVFEFPDNVRHICTTMPWTISPALMVLWGVCWMFVIQSRELEQKSLTPAGPIISPTPIDGFFDTHISSNGQTFPKVGLPDSITAVYGEQLALEDPYYSGWLDGFVNPLHLTVDNPQDPNFLTAGGTISETIGNPDLLGENIRVESSISPGPQVSLLQVDREIIGRDSPERSLPSGNADTDKKRIVCHQCRQSFANLFTLRRHQRHTHRAFSNNHGQQILCPNTGCKKSEPEQSFTRLDHLKRHLKTCKHKRDTRTTEPSPRPLSTAAFTPELSGGLQCYETPETQVQQEGSRLSDGIGDSGYDKLLHDMEKKYLELSGEVEKRERQYLAAKDARDSLQQAIQALKKTNDYGSERSCMRD